MKLANSALVVFLLVVSSPITTSFLFTTKLNDLNYRATGARSGVLFLSPEDLTSYMAKSHEEKLRAIKEVEEKKNTEIKTLKNEVTTLKERVEVPRESAVVLSSQPATGRDLSSMTTEELRAKLIQYQEFMAKYIVQAQQQKMKAVKLAEAATAARYEEKIKFLLAARSTTASSESEVVPSKDVAKVKITPKDSDVDLKSKPVNGAKKANGVVAPAPPPINLPSSDLFDERNKKIAAAGKAGKSRWADAEVKKASAESSKPSLLSTPATSPPPAPSSEVSPEIEAADHGLRSDGGVGGPTLAERVNLGQQLFTGRDAAATEPPAPIAEVSPIRFTYDLRNARIARAAAAGKSRWGNMENMKATSLTAASKSVSETASSSVAKKAEIVSTPEIEAADHGLRSDGGVGGPSLAERVNLGSSLLKDLE
jgi:hypothetical protein